MQDIASKNTAPTRLEDPPRKDYTSTARVQAHRKRKRELAAAATAAAAAAATAVVSSNIRHFGADAVRIYAIIYYWVYELVNSSE